MAMSVLSVVDHPAVSLGEDGSITVWNDGRGLPIRKHTTEDLWIPELVFGHLLTGSNFDDTQVPVWIGAACLCG